MGCPSEEMRRTIMAEARLVEAQQRVADLSSEMVDPRIRHEEAVIDAKEAGEKLLALVGRARKDQEEAQKIKDEHNKLLWVPGQFQFELRSIRHERK
jgi:hypothetical protein